MKKNYVYVNITLIILAIYVIFFPVISLAIEKINPSLTKCVYLQITGKECPLCGGTRYIKNISTVFTDVTYLFNFFGVILFVILFNIIFRISNLIRIKQGKNMEKTMIIDIIIHTILLCCYIAYEVVFIVNT